MVQHRFIAPSSTTALGSGKLIPPALPSGAMLSNVTVILLSVILVLLSVLWTAHSAKRFMPKYPGQGIILPNQSSDSTQLRRPQLHSFMESLMIIDSTTQLKAGFSPAASPNLNSLLSKSQLAILTALAENSFSIFILATWPFLIFRGWTGKPLYYFPSSLI